MEPVVKFIPPQQVRQVFDIERTNCIRWNKVYETYCEHHLKHKQDRSPALLSYSSIIWDDIFYEFSIQNKIINLISQHQLNKISQLSNILLSKYPRVYREIQDLAAEIKEFFLPDFSAFTVETDDDIDKFIYTLSTVMKMFPASSKINKLLNSIDDDEVKSLVNDLYAIVYRIGFPENEDLEIFIDVVTAMKIRDLKQLNVIGENWGMGGTYNTEIRMRFLLEDLEHVYDWEEYGIDVDAVDDKHGYVYDPPNLGPLQPEIDGELQVEITQRPEAELTVAFIPFIDRL